MDVLIIGASGMVGRKLAERLVADQHLGGQEITRLTLADVVEPKPEAASTDLIATVVIDLAVPGAIIPLIGARPDVIFHLVGVVSGEAEADFEKGYRVNLDGIRELFEAIRAEGLRSAYRPRLVFTSSVAVFGAPFPERIGDEFFTTPLTSYGTQKAICELLLADYSRRGIFDGIGIRLPTVCVRPGSPNLAASGFFSNILREPLAGRAAILPVPDDVRHWFVSPRTAIGFLIHAATIDLDRVGPRRNLNMPGVSATVAEEIEALHHFGGERAVALIRREYDPVISRIVSGWARDFNAERASSLGFVPDPTFRDIVRVHLEDEVNK